ncbi:thioesterase [Streptomyces lavendulae subsp. lavendulae]|uniref:thioesterase II family protein n=1 Tax=Streptomyces lavendulae TaxID=1914 RepID=UPI0024A5FB4A|nr:alpha/beta fold hydrolase [Streptomyces lavendulae]GLV87987.1 thioesterase [Streptomyces lavendulae subsp. lavendulae]
MFLRVSPAEPDALARVYLFAHAGGSSAAYADWAHPGRAVEFVAVQLPGRGARFGEPSIANVTDLAEQIASAIPDDLPYGLFGHSFGALLAFEVSRAIRARGKRSPVWLGVSAFPPPDGIPAAQPLHKLPGTELLHELSRRFDAIPQEVLEDEELAELVTEYVRADYEALETYAFAHSERLDLDIDVMAPLDDHHLPALLDGWRRHVHGVCTVRTFRGGHFYLRSLENRQRLCEILAASVFDRGAA